MTAIQRQGGTLFVSTLIFLLLLALLLLSNISPPKSLVVVEGSVINLTRIDTKGKLTGFRFCIGVPMKTFTYSDPDPNVADALTAIQNAKVVRVQYAVHRLQNPTLWGLEADGKNIASTSELEASRVTRFALLLVGACISGVVAILSFRSWLRSRRLRRAAQPFAAAEGFAGR